MSRRGESSEQERQGLCSNVRHLLMGEIINEGKIGRQIGINKNSRGKYYAKN